MAIRIEARGFPVRLPDGFDPPDFQATELPADFVLAERHLQAMYDAIRTGDLHRGDPVAALSVYARMAEDGSLVRLAALIQSTSRQRCIELVRLIEAQKEQPAIGDLFPEKGGKRRG